MMKKILLILLCLMLAASCLVMTACGGDDTTCTSHVDADSNGKCDNCGATVEVQCTEHVDADNDYLCDTCGAAVLPAGPAQIDVTLTVKDDSGKVLSGFTAILSHEENEEYNSVTSASDANGKITAKLYTGTYYVSFDYDVDTLGYYLTETNSITVADDTTSLELVLIDNNPDGSVDKPYTIMAGENEVLVPAGASYNFIIYRAVNQFFDATGATGIKIDYSDAEYTADAYGNIYFALLGVDTNSAEQLVITNTTDADITFSVEVVSAPGTYGNPIVLDTVGAAVTTPALDSDETFYYTYTATASGRFTITIGTDGAYVAMLNSTTYENVNSDEDAADGVIAFEVNEGDVIVIDITLDNAVSSDATVTFTPDLLVQQAY